MSSKLSTALAQNQGLGLVVGGVLVVGLVWFLFRDKLAAVGTALNPASDRNLAYRGVNAVGSAVTGEPDFSLGSWLYDVFNVDANLASNPKPKTDDEDSWWGNLTAKIGGG